MFFDTLPYLKTGMVISALNLLAIIASTRYFLFIARFPVKAWLTFNACAPSVVLYLAGFITGSRAVMAASLPFLLFFGGGGMIVFEWKGQGLFSQFGHTMMVLASAYTIAVLTIEGSWRAGIMGLAAGLIIFAVVFPLQQRYVKKYPDLFKKAGGARTGYNN